MDRVREREKKQIWEQGGGGKEGENSPLSALGRRGRVGSYPSPSLLTVWLMMSWTPGG